MNKSVTMLVKIFSILLISREVIAFNILAILSIPIRSHTLAYQPLFRELASRGHNVTVMNNYPNKDAPSNLKFVNVQAQSGPVIRSLDYYENLDSKYLYLWSAYNHIFFRAKEVELDCLYLFESEEVKAHLREGNQYDVVFVEQWKSDCGMAYALTFFDAPIIGIAAHILQPHTFPRLGLLFDAATEATYFSNSGPNHSLLQKVESYLLHNILKTLGRWYFQTSVYEVFDRFVPNNTLDIEHEAKNRMKMMFSHQHFSVTGPKLLPPQVLSVGGLHIGVPRSVPKRIFNSSATMVRLQTAMESLLIVLCLSSSALTFNILAIVSMPLRSHYMAFSPLFRELAIKGHNVTVINNFIDEDPPPNLRFVDIEDKKSGTTPTLEFYEHLNSMYMHHYNNLRHITFGSGNTRTDCENLFQSKGVKAHLSEENKYDVIFVEQFLSDCGLAYALTMYDAPIIGITSHTLLPMAYPRLGLPFDVAADAFYFSNSGPNPSLLQKLETFLLKTFFTSLGRWYLHTKIYEIFDRFVPNNTLDVERDAKSRMKMMFSYQHHSVTGARVLAPQLLEIGGIHVGVPKSISKEIEEFLSDAEHGAIYVSFGSNLKANTMSEKKRQQFLTAFRRIPQKVIWKYEDAPFKDEKILTASWFSQLDILCHPKVVAFISHGGMLSLSESAHCGKPMLTVPFFGDQFSNSAAIRSVGLGKTLYFDKINADNLEEAIKDLTSDEMQQNARRVSRLWHDRPQPVMESAIYWTEYVARHQTSPPSLPAKHNTWFESTLIDVYIVLIVILAGFFFVVRAIFRVLMLVLRFVVGLFKTEKRKKKGKRD